MKIINVSGLLLLLLLSVPTHSYLDFNSIQDQQIQPLLSGDWYSLLPQDEQQQK
jgi:hypothetical protein